MGVASPSRHESCKQLERNGCKKSRLCNQVVASHPKLLGSDSQPDIHNILTLVGVAGKFWNGSSDGVNRRTGRRGLYPSFKVANDIVDAVKIPTYPEA